MRVNLFADIMLSNIVEVFMQFWTELRGVKRLTVEGDITVFRSTFKFDNLYLNYYIEANKVNFSPFSRFELRTPVCTTPCPLMWTWAWWKRKTFTHWGNQNASFSLVFQYVYLHVDNSKFIEQFTENRLVFVLKKI